MFKFLFFSFILCCYAFANGFLSAKSVDSSNLVCHDLPKNTLQTSTVRNNLVVQYQKKGFLYAFADSVSPSRICVTKGMKVDSVILIVPKPGGWDTVLTTAMVAADWLEITLGRLENTGYPFGKVKLMPLQERANVLVFKLQVETGVYYNLDSIATGNALLSKGFLKRAAGIAPGMVFNQSKLVLLQNRISALDGFVSEGENQELRIVNSKLLAMLPVRKIKTDQINGLVGVATNPDGKVLFTGEAMGKFYNLFKNGVSAAFEWRSFKARSQEMYLSASLPYLFGVPFVSNFKVSFEKFDTLYTIFNRGVQFRFPISNNKSLFVGFQAISRTRIFADVETVKNLRQLPENPSANSSSFQLGFESSNLLPGEIPVKGYQFSFMGSAGFRSYVQDAELAAIRWISSAGVSENVFDSLKRTGNFKAPQYKLDYSISGYLPLSKIFVLKLSAVGFQFHAPVVYFNELTRFGGIKNLRGFNEQSIFANQMHSGAIELHLMAGKTGYIGPFYNFAWYRNQSISVTAGSDFLQGLGITSAIKTGAGILQIVWALGKTGKQSYVLNNSKFHFGISNSF